MESSAAPETGASRAPLTPILLGVVFVVSVVFISQAGWASAWYSAFKAIHVLAAVVWIGGGLLLTILGLIAERRRNDEDIAFIVRQAAMVGERLFAPAGLVVLAMGIAMMVNTNWGWGTFWVDAGLVGYALTFTTGVAVISPRVRKIDALTREKGATAPETIAAATTLLRIVRFDVAMLLLVVVDMVVKPFA